jgi:hypothetical protein
MWCGFARKPKSLRPAPERPPFDNALMLKLVDSARYCKSLNRWFWHISTRSAVGCGRKRHEADFKIPRQQTFNVELTGLRGFIRVHL